jgi:hypothetical protein
VLPGRAPTIAARWAAGNWLKKASDMLLVSNWGCVRATGVIKRCVGTLIHSNACLT